MDANMAQEVNISVKIDILAFYVFKKMLFSHLRRQKRISGGGGICARRCSAIRNSLNMPGVGCGN